MGGEETPQKQAPACLQEALPSAGWCQSRARGGGEDGKERIWALEGREGSELKGAN